MSMFIVVAASVQIAAQIQASRLQARMQRMQAQVAQIQGTIALEQGQFEARMQRRAGAEQATFIRRESRRGAGIAVAETFARGIELQGSPLTAIADQIWQDERAASVAIVNAEAFGVAAESRGRAGEASAIAEGSRLRAQAGFTETAGWLNAAATAVSAFALTQSIGGGRTQRLMGTVTAQGSVF